MHFLLFRIFQQLALVLKKTVALKFFTVMNMHFLPFRILEQLALTLKKQRYPENFHCVEYVFYIQEF